MLSGTSDAFPHSLFLSLVSLPLDAPFADARPFAQKDFGDSSNSKLLNIQSDLGWDSLIKAPFFMGDVKYKLT